MNYCYQVMCRLNRDGLISEWSYGDIYKQRERALKICKLSNEIMGEAQLVTLNETESGYELISVEAI